MSGSILMALDLPAALKQRIKTSSDEKPNPNGAFVLYLPTVVLRKKHNPALALAARIANHLKIPLLIVAIVLDDSHMPQTDPKHKPVAFTARKVAFTLEAIQYSAQEWESMGAGVAIRVHGPACRTPHHLTLAQKSAVVVFDEPFVHPYLRLTQVVERTCRLAKIATFRVDGSTIVPPLSKLHKIEHGESYKGVPTKAWAWLKIIADQRHVQVKAAVNEGQLDAPELLVRLEPGFFLTTANVTIKESLPKEWCSQDNSCPGKRPWTVTDLASISDLKRWSMSWPGIDTTVPPCQQTHGSKTSGMERWSRFKQNGLRSYARTRNNIMHPHSVSRMSCYLNLGVVSIFSIVHDLWQSNAGGKQKFEDEIIKWREISYAHAFACPDFYNRELAVPSWARQYMTRYRNQGTCRPMSVEQLETGTTSDKNWNAMQEYLISTGELHNNARMTWGKTMVYWQKNGLEINDLLEQICYLNDRFALDGLSPPSYAGLLWCLGWGDKPKDGSGAISEKWASAYRTGPAGFVEAKQALLTINSQTTSISNMLLQPKAKKHKPMEDDDQKRSESECENASLRKVSSKGNITHFFRVAPRRDLDAHPKTVG